MTTIIEVRRLSGIDIGKTIAGLDALGRQFHITIRRIEQDDLVYVWATHVDGFSDRHPFRPTDTVTITGKPADAGDTE